MALTPGRRYEVYGSIEDLGDGTDIGGKMEDCSNADMLCATFNTVPIIVPRAETARWSEGDLEVREISRTDQIRVMETRQAGKLKTRYGYQVGKGLVWMSFIVDEAAADVTGPFHARGTALWSPPTPQPALSTYRGKALSG